MVSQNTKSEEMKFEYYAMDNKTNSIGVLMILTYIAIWISSLLLPVIFLTLLLKEYYFLSNLILILCTISYLPSKFDLQNSSVRKLVFHATTKYYRKMTIGWIKGSKPCDNDVPTLFCVHPHGIFSQTGGFMFASSYTKDTLFMFSNLLYMSPFFRLCARIIGKPSKCDKHTMQKLMKTKQDCAIITGGFHEASIHSDINDRIFLKNRKGFVKYAIQYQYTLTPIFGFGEKDTFYNIPGFWSFRLWLNEFGIPGILPFGRWICQILPRNERLHIVVDTPLLPPKLGEDEKVTKEMVDEHHAKYMEKLKKLHGKHAPIYYQRESRLEIW